MGPRGDTTVLTAPVLDAMFAGEVVSLAALVAEIEGTLDDDSELRGPDIVRALLGACFIVPAEGGDGHLALATRGSR